MKSIIERFDKKVVHLPFDRQLLRLLRHFIHSGMHLSQDNRLVGVFCAVDVCHARVASVGGQRYRSHHHRHYRRRCRRRCRRRQEDRAAASPVVSPCADSRQSHHRPYIIEFAARQSGSDESAQFALLLLRSASLEKAFGKRFPIVIVGIIVHSHYCLL